MHEETDTRRVSIQRTATALQYFATVLAAATLIVIAVALALDASDITAPITNQAAFDVATPNGASAGSAARYWVLVATLTAAAVIALSYGALKSLPFRLRRITFERQLAHGVLILTLTLASMVASQISPIATLLLFGFLLTAIVATITGNAVTITRRAPTPTSTKQRAQRWARRLSLIAITVSGICVLELALQASGTAEITARTGTLAYTAAVQIGLYAALTALYSAQLAHAYINDTAIRTVMARPAGSPA